MMRTSQKMIDKSEHKAGRERTKDYFHWKGNGWMEKAVGRHIITFLFLEAPEKAPKGTNVPGRCVTRIDCDCLRESLISAVRPHFAVMNASTVFLVE